MVREELVEKGIVIKSEKGFADVALTASENCEDCSAKLFCKPSENEQKILHVIDKYNTEEGDEVTISVAGNSILKVSLILYGLPLLMLVAVIIGGMQIFNDHSEPELFSSLVGLIFLGVYYTICFLIIKKKDNSNLLPKITLAIKKFS